MTKLQCIRHRSAARVLMVVATAFWVWFGVGSAYVERGGSLNWLMHIMVPAGVFILSALAAWRWEGIGGGLLMLEGIAALAFILYAFFRGKFTASTLILMGLTLGLPPLAAGLLFLVSWQQSRGPKRVAGEGL